MSIPTFPNAARIQLTNPQLRKNLKNATTTIRQKRDARVAETPEWEDLRLAGAAIKSDSLNRLGDLLLQFESTVTSAGGVVHWARNSAQAQAIIIDLVQATGVHDVVKVKSMTTAEIGLNPALERVGVRAYETDLAELIVQLGRDEPSHIVVPAIHRNRDEIRDIFRDEMSSWGRAAPEGLSNDPSDLANAARLHLRERFLESRVAISGANFLVAETGTVAVVESEGNGRMCLTLPETLITIAGIDKIIPRFEDLDVFLQLLPRSATGERMNPYTSLWTGVTPGDGPSAFHIVLLDNGRTTALGDHVGREALRCIRCAACLNVCPVYERVGGHAYGSVYPGPIGAILTPQLSGVTTTEVAASLPYASTLCGACFDACPVRINIPKLLVHLRGEIVDMNVRLGKNREERAIMTVSAWVLDRQTRLRVVGRALRIVTGRRWRRFVRLPGLASGWTRFRSLPVARSARLSWDASRTRVPGPSTTITSRALRVIPSAFASNDNMSLDARKNILSAIARIAAHPPVVIPRTYRAEKTIESDDLLHMFEQRLLDYHAHVNIVTSRDVAGAVASALARDSDRRVVLPDESLRNLVTFSEAEVIVDRLHSSIKDLDEFDAVITTCSSAVASTGTIVLDGREGQGRRAVTLMPDHHIIVVQESQIVESVTEALNAVDSNRPQTWLSGPSATSDIELQRVEGVHGPRKLDVIIVRP